MHSQLMGWGLDFFVNHVDDDDDAWASEAASDPRTEIGDWGNCSHGGGWCLDFDFIWGSKGRPTRMPSIPSVEHGDSASMEQKMGNQDNLQK